MICEDGFNILKNYALDLLSTNHGEYFGSGAMKIGLIEFCNTIMPDGVTVSSAKNVHTVSADLGSVKSAVEGMVQKKGFTNMSQAFLMKMVSCMKLLKRHGDCVVHEALGRGVLIAAYHYIRVFDSWVEAYSATTQ